MDGRQAEGDAVAIYTALIRHELALPLVGDALAELERRLPVRPTSTGVPLKAPAVARMKDALKQLRAGEAPSAALEAFTEDLRFLRLFDDDGPALDDAAISRLMLDVVGPKPATKRQRARPRASKPATQRRASRTSVTPIRRR